MAEKAKGPHYIFNRPGLKRVLFPAIPRCKKCGVDLVEEGTCQKCTIEEELEAALKQVVTEAWDKNDDGMNFDFEGLI